MNLVELTALEISKLDRENIFVIVPLGSVEQHGPHLPTGTKCFLSETIAYEAAKLLKPNGINYLMTPVIPFMPCNSSDGFPGSFSVSARTYSDMLYELGSSFHNQGFKYLFFVNLSISPEALKAVATACDDLNALDDFTAADPLPIWNFSKDDRVEAVLRQAGLEPKNEMHGDAKETGALMYVAKDLMHPEIARELPPCCINRTWETIKGHFSFLEMGSQQGYLGSPAQGTAEIGREFIQSASEGLLKLMLQIQSQNTIPDLPIQVRMLMKMVDLDEM